MDRLKTEQQILDKLPGLLSDENADVQALYRANVFEALVAVAQSEDGGRAFRKKILKAITVSNLPEVRELAESVCIPARRRLLNQYEEPEVDCSLAWTVQLPSKQQPSEHQRVQLAVDLFQHGIDVHMVYELNQAWPDLEQDLPNEPLRWPFLLLCRPCGQALEIEPGSNPKRIRCPSGKHYHHLRKLLVEQFKETLASKAIHYFNTCLLDASAREDPDVQENAQVSLPVSTDENMGRSVTLDSVGQKFGEMGTRRGPRVVPAPRLLWYTLDRFFDDLNSESLPLVGRISLSQESMHVVMNTVVGLCKLVWDLVNGDSVGDEEALKMQIEEYQPQTLHPSTTGRNIEKAKRAIDGDSG
jgi:hypothetical protein